ncbi:MAG: hypothetical protein LT071_04895, partial [Nocardioides sp.]|nr:hypothetical protein [Nocardioides sp.]
DLAGLPGLLARTSPDVLDTPVDGVPPPDTLLPRLTAQVLAHRRRRWRNVAAATAAAAVVLLGAVWGASVLGEAGPGPVPPSAAPAAPALPMTPVGAGPLSAEVVLEDVAWGTRLSLTCRYALGTGDARYDVPERAGRYALVVHVRGGDEEQVATWRAVPGRTLTVDAATAAERRDIERVEVRNAQGVAVLRLTT